MGVSQEWAVFLLKQFLGVGKGTYWYRSRNSLKLNNHFLSDLTMILSTFDISLEVLNQHDALLDFGKQYGPERGE
jgi:hypothetical protein